MTSINNSTEKTQLSANPKTPKLVLDNIWAFPPNRDILGGTAYFITTTEGNILVDCPSYHENNIHFCQARGGVKYLFVTNRDGISKHVSKFKADFNCQLIIQEQEVYLLPNLEALCFENEYDLNDSCRLIWTSGYSPGSSCLYYRHHGGVLFSGRHLLPIKGGKVTPLKFKKTFHWRRQKLNAQRMCDRTLMEPITYTCPGANTGYLRGKGFAEEICI